LSQEVEKTDVYETSPIAVGIKKLAENKYYDAILLISVAAAFGILLMLSSMG
jgi:hypothetical protein